MCVAVVEFVGVWIWTRLMVETEWLYIYICVWPWRMECCEFRIGPHHILSFRNYFVIVFTYSNGALPRHTRKSHAIFRRHQYTVIYRLKINNDYTPRYSENSRIFVEKLMLRDFPEHITFGLKKFRISLSYARMGIYLGNVLIECC